MSEPSGGGYAARIVFLPVPESLRGQVDSLIGAGHHGHPHSPEEDFFIDPSIPIPVELGPGDADLRNLSGEMILSGMLRVLAEDPGRENADYYRRFVLSFKPDIFSEFTEAAILKAKNGDYDPALEIVDALNGLFPGSPAALLNRALILEKRSEALGKAGREEEAEAGNVLADEAYRQILSLSPPLPDGLFNAGFYFMNRRDYEQAKACFSAYIPLASGDPEKRARAASIVKEIESHSLDDAAFREAYECIRGGEERRGLELVRDFLERKPLVWNGWFLLGWGLRRLGRWEDGETAFRKAVELGGGIGDTRNELAICLMEMGDYKAARKELEAGLREDPENVKIISNLGVLALKTGNDDEAAGFFRTVLELEPEDPLAGTYLRGKTF
jgi:tetratricopeptide (TPR) repeat protein